MNLFLSSLGNILRFPLLCVYPLQIIYEGKQPQINIAQLEITQGIEKYTGLKKNKDYWIGVSWEY
jgi:hypothetical protein